jgi:hypothetical protein
MKQVQNSQRLQTTLKFDFILVAMTSTHQLSLLAGEHATHTAITRAWLKYNLGMCPCRLEEELGRICAHAKALILAIGGTDTRKDKDWVHAHYRLDTCGKCYSAQAPAMTIAGKVLPTANVAPPDYPPGRPKSKRQDRSFYRKTNTRKVCRACGLVGHHESTTCEKPSTEFRYKRFKHATLQWCERFSDVNIEESS